MAFNWERSPIASSSISAIMPAREAEKTVCGVLQSLVDQLAQVAQVARVAQLKRDYEVLVVDDGSKDGTSAAVESFAVACPQVRLLRHETRRGYGAALRTGLEVARHPLVVTLPADGAYQPNELPRFLEVIDQVDMVCGARRPRPRVKTWLQRRLVRLFFGVPLTDPACHFRLYRRSVFDRFPIQSDGCFADVEIAAKANFLECLLTEVNVTWQTPTHTIAGPPALRDGWRLFRNASFEPPQR